MADDTISNMQSPTCIKRVANQLHTVHATNLMEMQVQVPKEVADDTSDALEPTSTFPLPPQ
jgi:copper chaperone CopZ